MNSLHDYFGQDPFLTLCVVLLGILGLWGVVFVAVTAFCKANARELEAERARELLERTQDEEQCYCTECRERRRLKHEARCFPDECHCWECEGIRDEQE